MKFTLNAPERSHGIRIIGSIPDLRLCRVEGLNGVGKTLAIHLLEICTGQQPYRTRPDAWRTLCQYLGPVEVTIEGLSAERTGRDGGAPHTLRFAFDWRGRDDDAAPREITRELFDEITLDGEPIGEMDEVRHWLSVVRVAGDETLTQTIAGIVAHDRELLRAASRVAASRGDRADRVLSDLLRPFPAEPAQRAFVVVEETRALAVRRKELERERSEQREQLDRLEQAQAARAAVSDVAANAETLGSEIARLREQFATAQTRSKESGEELHAAREQARLSTEASKQLKSAERTFNLRLGKLKRTEEAIEAAAGRIGIAPDPAALAAAHEVLERERREVAEKRGDLTDLFALRDLLDGLVTALAPAAAGGLRARVVATVGEQSVTAGSLLDAVRRRRDRLVTDAPAVEELDVRLSALEVREQALDELSGLFADGDKRRKDLVDAERTLQELGEQTESAEHSVAELAASHAAAQRVEIEVGSALGAAERQLAQLGGGLSPEDLAAELDRRLTEAQTTSATLQEDLRKARGRLAAFDDELDAATSRRDQLESLAAELRETLAGQASVLAAGDAHARLRGALGDRAPNPAHDLEDLARAWVAVHEAEERTVLRLRAVRGGLDRLVGSMNELVEVIQQGERPSPELDAVRKLYQARMLQQLSQPELLEALFDGGELTRVDLAAREVRWHTAAGEPRVRPFEAFSSGERAFAYVQARLAAMSEVSAFNRVVAIDEFGAFLSRDRLVRLQEVVLRQLDEGLVHQAIVVLPLTRPVIGTVDQEVGTGANEYLTGVFDVLAAA